MIIHVLDIMPGLAAVDSTNSFTFGDSNISVIRCNTTSITLSDARDKTDIDLPLGINFNTLRPVKFMAKKKLPIKWWKKLGAGLLLKSVRSIRL